MCLDRKCEKCGGLIDGMTITVVVDGLTRRMCQDCADDWQNEGVVLDVEEARAQEAQRWKTEDEEAWP